jgi:hypothetical protein
VAGAVSVDCGDEHGQTWRKLFGGGEGDLGAPHAFLRGCERCLAPRYGLGQSPGCRRTQAHA